MSDSTFVAERTGAAGGPPPCDQDSDPRRLSTSTSTISANRKERRTRPVRRRDNSDCSCPRVAPTDRQHHPIDKLKMLRLVPVMPLYVDSMAVYAVNCYNVRKGGVAWRGRCSTSGRRSTCPEERRTGFSRPRTNVECRHRRTSGWRCSADCGTTKPNDRTLRHRKKRPARGKSPGGPLRHMEYLLGAGRNRQTAWLE